MKKFYRDLKEYIKDLRVEKKLTQHELAEQFNVTNALISNMEKGKIIPSKKQLMNYSNFFDAPIEKLLHLKAVAQTEQKEQKATTNELGLFLKNLRIQANLSQKELADQIDLTVTTISSIETKGNPSVNTLKLYSDFFNIPLTKLLAYKDGKFEKLEIKDVEINSVYNIPLYNLKNHQVQESISVISKDFEKYNSQNLFAIKLETDILNKIIPKDFICIINKAIQFQNCNNQIILYSLDNQISVAKFEILDTYVKLCTNSYITGFNDRILFKKDFEEHNFKILGQIIYAYQEF